MKSILNQNLCRNILGLLLAASRGEFKSRLNDICDFFCVKIRLGLMIGRRIHSQDNFLQLFLAIIFCGSSHNVVLESLWHVCLKENDIPVNEDMYPVLWWIRPIIDFSEWFKNSNVFQNFVWNRGI